MKASVFFFSFILLNVAGNCFAKDEAGKRPSVPVHELVDYGKSSFDEVKVLADLSLDDIARIAPVSAGISFSKVKSNHGEFGVVAYDRQQLNQLFGKTFVLELQTSKRYPLVAKPTGDSVLLTIKLDNFISYLQPIEGRTQSQVRTVAVCTLNVEVREMDTGAIIMTISDEKKIKLRRHLRDNEIVASMNETKKIFQKWATDLRKILEKLG